MVRKLLAALLCCAAIVSGVRGLEWTVCDGTTKESISEVVLKPDPPSPGVTAEFSIKGSSDVEISSGTLELGVTYRGIPIYSETKDLCETAACPVKKGPYAVHVSEYFPPITPPGPYVVRLSGKGTDEAQLMCLDVRFTVTPPFAVGNAGAALRQATTGLLERAAAAVH